MYCRHCGTQLSEGSRFCPNCGQPTDADRSNGNTAGNGATNNAVRPDGFEQQFNDFGDGIKDAAQDVKDGFTHAEDAWRATGEEFEQNREEFKENWREAGARAEEAAEDIKRNWRDYLTPENIEIYAACGLVLPLAFYIVSTVLMTIGDILFPMEAIFTVAVALICIIFVVCSVLAVGAAIYTVALNKDKQTTWGWIALAGSVLAFLATLGVMGVMGRSGGVVGIILMLVTFLYGLVLIAHVLIRGLGIETQPNVSEDLGSYKQAYDDYKAAHPSDNQSEAERIANDPRASYFDGTGWSNLGYNLLIVLVGGITCGIATPWMLCKKYKWQKQHTVIEGRRLDFNGSGASLLGHWILWEILTIITCGIYSFFMHVALKKWEMKHTYYQDTNIPFSQGTQSLFDGNSFQYFGYGLLASLLTILTCGIASPWAINIIYKWEAKHEVVCGDRMRYDGTGLGLFVQYIVVYLLTIITCGIYASWAEVRLLRYQYKHYHVTDIVDAQ